MIVFKKSRKKVNNSGFAAMLTIVIIGAAALIFALNATLLGLGELDLGYTSQKSGEAFALSDGCMEETLERLRLDDTYGVGTTTVLSFANGSCTINVASSGSNTIVFVVGTVDNHYRKIRATTTISSGVVTLDSWNEVSD